MDFKKGYLSGKFLKVNRIQGLQIESSNCKILKLYQVDLDASLDKVNIDENDYTW